MPLNFLHMYFGNNSFLDPHWEVFMVHKDKKITSNLISFKGEYYVYTPKFTRIEED